MLDLRGVCGFADYFVFATGGSDRHVRALADAAVDAAARRGTKRARCRGQDRRALGARGPGSDRGARVQRGRARVLRARAPVGRRRGARRRAARSGPLLEVARPRGARRARRVRARRRRPGRRDRARPARRSSPSCASRYPHAQDRDVGRGGRPARRADGQLEVGHTTLGAGPRDRHGHRCASAKAIEAGELATNPALQELLSAAQRARRGAPPDGPRLRRRRAQLARPRVRDPAPVRPARDQADPARVHRRPRHARRGSPGRYIEPLEARAAASAGGCIATVSGRYFAMDRDKRWDRVARAYQAMVLARGLEAPSAVAAVEAARPAARGDEFIQPTVIAGTRALPRRRRRAVLQLPRRPRARADQRPHPRAALGARRRDRGAAARSGRARSRP